LADDFGKPRVHARENGAKDMATKPVTPSQNRATGRTYLAALAEACPPETWRDVVTRAVEDAKQGDRNAREWLASYLVGKPDSAATTLHQLAVEDAAGTDPIADDATWEATRSALSTL
jgi:hypothetical protein